MKLSDHLIPNVDNDMSKLNGMATSIRRASQLLEITTDTTVIIPSFTSYVTINETLAVLNDLLQQLNLTFKLMKRDGLSIPKGYHPGEAKALSSIISERVNSLTSRDGSNDFHTTIPYYERLD